MIDFSSPLGQVRLLSGDTKEDSFLNADEELAAFLSINSDNVYLAAAAALDSAAVKVTMRLKKYRTLDLEVDGPAVGKALREYAKDLRKRAEEEQPIEVIEMVTDCFQYRDSLLMDAMRRG